MGATRQQARQVKTRGASIFWGLVRQDPRTWETGFINNQRDPPSQEYKTLEILLLYNGFFEKASETWQSTVTKCVPYCTVLQTFVVLNRSLTQPHQAARTRTTRSKGRVSPPRFPHEDGGNQLIAPIRSFMPGLFFPH